MRNIIHFMQFERLLLCVYNFKVIVFEFKLDILKTLQVQLNFNLEYQRNIVKEQLARRRATRMQVQVTKMHNMANFSGSLHNNHNEILLLLMDALLQSKYVEICFLMDGYSTHGSWRLSQHHAQRVGSYFKLIHEKFKPTSKAQK